MTVEQLKIVIAEPSVIIRSGITVALKRVPGFRIQPVEIQTLDSLKSYLSQHKTDVLVVNPMYWGLIDIVKLKADSNNQELKTIALVYSMLDESILKNYDETIGIYDSVEQLKVKLDKLIEQEATIGADDVNTLSAREKEIVVCVVKGLTNKEIAGDLFLSTHTVISHRRNIARKLEIHSTAGLTVYAIMNKLIGIDEIKQNTQF
jgi:DNA-binding NarL/FixJ family response regulator